MVELQLEGWWPDGRALSQHHRGRLGLSGLEERKGSLAATLAT